MYVCINRSVLINSKKLNRVFAFFVTQLWYLIWFRFGNTDLCPSIFHVIGLILLCQYKERETFFALSESFHKGIPRTTFYDTIVETTIYTYIYGWHLLFSFLMVLQHTFKYYFTIYFRALIVQNGGKMKNLTFSPQRWRIFVCWSETKKT